MQGAIDTHDALGSLQKGRKAGRLRRASLESHPLTRGSILCICDSLSTRKAFVPDDIRSPPSLPACSWCQVLLLLTACAFPSPMKRSLHVRSRNWRSRRAHLGIRQGARCLASTASSRRVANLDFDAGKETKRPERRFSSLALGVVLCLLFPLVLLALAPGSLS